MDTRGSHIPVLEREVCEYLRLPEGGILVDGTVGMGGHSQRLAQQLGERGRIVAIDRDQKSLEEARRNLKDCGCRVDFVHGDFRHVDEILSDLKIDAVDGVLFDFGISSFQLDDPQRGFSFKEEGPLDMRMNQDAKLTAYDLVNSLSEKEISVIIRDFGQERFHQRIARSIVHHRPIHTTKGLSDVVLKAIPSGRKWQKIHPATRTFQAFRIAVNRELESIDLAITRSVPFLKKEGRICAISFHSLEDRIVKLKFRALAKEGIMELVVKKPLMASEEEIDQNLRSRSARLRVAEKI